jgi:hypothetical protein
MLKKFHTLLFLLVSFLVSCEQAEEQDPAGPLEDCVTQMSSWHGAEVQDQYIVSFEDV